MCHRFNPIRLFWSSRSDYSEMMNESPLIDRILGLIKSPNYQPTKPKRLLKLLDLPEEDFPQVRRAVKQLIRQGLIGYGANHLVVPDPAQTSDKKLVEGIFRASNGAFGFVRPSSSARAMAEDIFIPPKCVGSAMDGDLVEVLIRRGREGETEGEIKSVLNRARRQFPGTLDFTVGESAVWIDGLTTEKPIRVGDTKGLPVSQGDKVIVEIVRYPDAENQGEGIIIEVLGSSKNPAVDTRAVMIQFGLPEAFPEEVVEQARATADAFQEAVPEGRHDLTNVLTLTIDPVDARDFDDAISLRRNEVGNWELMVHVADVSHFVPRDSVLDVEAQDRATSTYLPDRVIPMLPEQISNFVASLQPDRIRLTKTVKMEYTDEGVHLFTEVFNAAIRNDRRFSYEEVDAFLVNSPGVLQSIPEDLQELLRNMDTLAMTLRRRRTKHGAIELNLPEVKIDLDKTGKVKGAHLVLHTESHQIIEEFMLAANQAVATWLDDLNLPFLRRVHPPPNPMRLRRLTNFVKELGIPCDDLQNRFEIQRVVEFVRNTSSEYAVNYAILKSMSKAVYQAEHERHYALDMTHYCHFTSPIRRYPDLVVHRIVQSIIEGHATSEPFPILVRLGLHCSDQEQNAESAERELVKVKLLHFMSKRIGEHFTSVIINVRMDGFVVRGNEIPFDGFVAVETLPRDRYRFDRQGQVLEGYHSHNRFRMGDVVEVRVVKVDFIRRQLSLGFVNKIADALIPTTRLNRRASRSDDRDRKAGGGKTKKRNPDSARKKRRK